eukprot:gene2969-3254_t
MLDDGGSSDACATFNSSTVAPGDLSTTVSVADGQAGSQRDSTGGNNSTGDMPAAAATAAASAAGNASGAASAVGSSAPGGPDAPLAPVCTTFASSRFSHGLPCAKEVLSFLIDCIAQRRSEADTAILAGGPILQAHEVLLTLLHRELFAAMATAVVLAVWQVLGPCSVLQLETILQSVLLRLADGKDTASPEQQEAALEGLLDLCRCPGFLHTVFLSCDCRLERSNLFEDLAGLLSKTAFPGGAGGSGGKGLGTLHLISLEGVLAVLAALAERLNDPPPQLQPTNKLGHYVDVWAPICKGPAAATAAEVAAFEKGLKHRVMLAVDHFNKDHKKGFQFLQANKLLPVLQTPAAADSGDAAAQAAKVPSAADKAAEKAIVVDEDQLTQCIGYFLRVCPGLNKTTIGELLGEPDKFNLKVLDSFTSTFEFKGLTFDVGLRTFLESFKLPGEAQKIDRIINCFGRAYYRWAWLCEPGSGWAGWLAGWLAGGGWGVGGGGGASVTASSIVFHTGPVNHWVGLSGPQGASVGLRGPQGAIY